MTPNSRLKKRSSISTSCVLFAFLIILALSSVQSRDVNEARYVLDKWKMSRRSYCIGSAGKCFSSGQCCDGLICAAFDDYFGQKPEVPGYCVKEKDLQVCAASTDCEVGSRCVSLGRTGERYCLPRTEVKNLIKQQAATLEELELPQALKQHAETKGNGLGAHCETSSECKSTSDGSNLQLCCQDVRRGRQGVKRICDRITAISVCLP